MCASAWAFLGNSGIILWKFPKTARENNCPFHILEAQNFIETQHFQMTLGWKNGGLECGGMLIHAEHKRVCEFPESESL